LIKNKQTKLVNFYHAHQQDVWIVLALLVFASFFRFIHFTARLNFSADQATSSLRARDIWQNREVTLVGIPITSWEYQGHQARVSSTAYYLQLIPLLLGNFDPVGASVSLTIIAILMVIPLYFGSKKLTNTTGAILITTSYSLLPNFVNYTTFLWNPNLQLVLAPLVVFFMGLIKTKRRPLDLILCGGLLGLMLTLHYQFILTVLTITIIYSWIFTKKKQAANILYLLGGLLIGFSPLIISELNTNFYLTKTLILIFQHWTEVTATAHVLPLHYFNSAIFFFLVGLTILLTRLLKEKAQAWLTVIWVISLIIIDNVIFLPKAINYYYYPARDWSYATEVKIQQLIADLQPTNFNLINLAYVDPLANVQKYLLATKNPPLYRQLSADYYQNQQLLIIAPKDYDLSQAINYEINTFVPESTQSVAIDDHYQLYWWRRENPNCGGTGDF